ncbi:MAG: hypothetical protein LBR55_04260 [Bacteroidales bacterium]|jgi:hypothetical protein|nr:hypothetical protein [Bacteroidales bacterium]
MKKVFVIIGLLFSLGLTSIVAQDYVGTYSGTLTITPTVYTLGNIDDVNLEIENQTLQVNTDWLGWYDIPIFKEGEPANIGFIQVAFAPSGTITAPDIDGMDGTVTFSIVSGSVANNTITLTVRMVDKATGGTHADVILSYTGTKQEPIGMNESVTAEKIIAGFYSITGKKLNEEPQNGVYIVKYTNGTSEKVMKK